MEADLHPEMVAYAGSDYAEPKEVEVGTLHPDSYESIDDLIDALVAFRDAHARGRFERQDSWEGDAFWFIASRMETPEETAARVQEYRRLALERIAGRRAQYERLRREFG
jgi:hypothetical protein